jgi:maltooligosyltrehalose trehalohydrolase
MAESSSRRRLPVGAEPLAGGGVSFRVWAPRAKRTFVVLEPDGATFELEAADDGYFSGDVAAAGTGTLYRYRLDDGPAWPDPASRFQPQGPHGPSQVVDPDGFGWTDAEWRGVPAELRVLYEMHIGSFTREGTWDAARERLPVLADLGVTLLEVMPVAEFPGAFGWGYDGVNLFAPSRLYGGPDDFRRFIDAAHAQGLGVILDVVYNHLGPDGNYLGHFSDDYFTDRYETEWGEPFNFDGRDSRAVREYVLSNAEHWVREYHIDGFRLDATQAIFDAASGSAHILAELTERVRAAAGGRALYLVGENEPQRVTNVLPAEAGGYGLDAIWNDDWHHSAIVALTGRNEAYYSDYLGAPQEFVSAAKHGFLYQGQHYTWQKQRRGTPALGLDAARFVAFLQNHDQVANSARGDRVHRLCSAAQLRAMTTLLLLGPATPLLFQGQEFAASSPFLYFADHAAPLAASVERGRRAFLAQFPSLAQAALQEEIPDATAWSTFERCILDHDEREAHAEVHCCTGTCCGCAGMTKRFAAGRRAASMAPCSAARRSCCATSVRGGTVAGTGCCWSTSGANARMRPRPNRCWRRPRTRSGGNAGAARTYATAASAIRNRRRRMDAGTYRGTVRSYSSPSRRERSHERTDSYRSARGGRDGAGGRAARARVARHQRHRRLRIDDARERADATLSRHPGGRAAEPARPDRDADRAGRARATRRWHPRGAQRRRARRDGLTLPAAEHVHDFRLEALLPVWTFSVGDALLEKRVWMPFGQNTVHVHYRYLEGRSALRLHLRPALNFRAVEEPVSTPLRAPYGIAARDGRFEIASDPAFPPLRVRMIGGARHSRSSRNA